MTDRMLRDAAREAAVRYAQAVEDRLDASLTFEPSPNFEEKMQRLLRQAGKKARDRRFLRSAAAMLAAVLLTSVVWLSCDAQARAAVSGWVRELWGTIFVVRHTGGATDGQTEPQTFRPVWLPSGYAELRSTEGKGSRTVLYAGSDGRLLRFSCAWEPEGITWFLDAEDAEPEPVEVGGAAADYLPGSDADTAAMLVWSQSDGTAFCLSGFLSREELIRIAQSVAPME